MTADENNYRETASAPEPQSSSDGQTAGAGDNQQLKCPVCGLPHISPDRDRCPQCDADLICFRVLDSLPEELPEPDEKPPSGTKTLPWPLALAGILLTVLLIAVILFQFHRFRQLEVLLEDQGGSIKSLNAKLTKLQDAESEFRSETADISIAKAEEQILLANRKFQGPVSPSVPRTGFVIGEAEILSDSTAPQSLSFWEETQISEQETKASLSVPDIAKPGPDGWNSGHLPENPEEKTGILNGQQLGNADFRTYNATKNDTLWDISVKYYGAGHYYPILLEHNRHIGIYSIGKGVQVKVLRDPRIARKIYLNIIERKGYNTYWLYTVAKGDTLRTLITKYYKIRNMKKRISELENPDVPLPPGKKLRILLK